MPSQEDYLDNLLKGLNGPEEENETEIVNGAKNMDFSGIEIEEFEEPGVSIGVEDTRSMTEEDIARLLSETQDAVSEEEQNIEFAGNDEDLLDILSQGDDSDLQDIHDLLQKSDNNEAINEDIIALLQDVPDDEIDLFENMMDETEQSDELIFDEKMQRATERKRERDERRAEKMALREAKKAAKMEAKAAKEAERKAKKEALTEAKKLQKKASEIQELEKAELEDNIYNQEFEEPVNSQQLQQDDLEDLDALLNMAENAMASGDSDNNDFFASFAADEISQTEAPQQEDTTQKTVDTDSIVEKIVADKQPRKKRMISRIIDLLTEEVDEEEDATQNNEDIRLSDENQNIIDELDKGKKKKGKKDKQSKKGKKADSTPEGETEEDSAEDKAEKKTKKEKKAKKEKIPKEIISEETERSSGSKLSFKKILPIALVCLSLAVIIILVANFAGDYSAKQAGREAYYNGDYQTCYQNLYGKKLNESEQVMYSKSESILRIRLWIREYEMFAEEGAEAEALDSLIQSVNEYPTLYQYAAQWTAEKEVSELYAQILGILSDKYQMTEEQALEIATAEDDEEYSGMVYAIVDGEGFGSWNQQEREEPEKLQDVLPEEEDLEAIPFVDNNDN